MGGLGEGFVGRRLVAEPVQENQIARHVVEKLRRPVFQCRLRVDDRRQILVFDGDQFNRIGGRVGTVGNHHGDRLADEADAVGRKRVTVRGLDLHAIDAGEGDQRAGGDQVGLKRILAGQHEMDARYRERRLDIDRNDARMRLIGPQECGMELAVQHLVGGICALAGNKSHVFPAAGEDLMITAQNRSPTPGDLMRDAPFPPLGRE